jgi:hypothetical protein
MDERVDHRLEAKQIVVLRGAIDLPKADILVHVAQHLDAGRCFTDMYWVKRSPPRSMTVRFFFHPARISGKTRPLLAIPRDSTGPLLR